jgi:hypothetical protein
MDKAVVVDPLQLFFTFFGELPNPGAAVVESRQRPFAQILSGIIFQNIIFHF